MDRRRPTSYFLPLCALGAVLVAHEAIAHAEEGFALGKYQPTFAGDDLFSVPSPWTPGGQRLHLMLLTDYADSPLLLVTQTARAKSAAIVSKQLIVHTNASFSLRRVAINLDLPFGYQSGDGPTLGGQAFAPPNPAGLGDLRLGVRVPLFGENDAAFQVGVGGLVWLPTGRRSAYMSDGSVRGEPMLIAGGVLPRMLWSFAVGPEFRSADKFVSVTPGTAIRMGAGATFFPGTPDLQIGPEVTFGLTTSDLQKRTTDLEVLVGAKYRFLDDFVFGAAGSYGLLPGVGTPDFRTILSLSFSRTDRRHETGPDVSKGPAPSAGCLPLPDRDGDGVPDSLDRCPDEKGTSNADPTRNGCPSDRDNDTIPDSADACPDQPGPRSEGPAKSGCPITEPVAPPPQAAHDRDGDRIPDERDACPSEKGPADGDASKNGCPRDVRVNETQILILQQIQFATGKAIIQAVSDPLLDTVAQVIREHPEITQVEIGGHTDNQGAEDVNKALSQARADAVRAALVRRGIEGKRLSAQGYGSQRPIMSNVTTMGRKRNRRVEFRILERKAL